MSRPQQFVIPGPLPRPPRLRGRISFLSYDVYERPNIPAWHPNSGRNGAWFRRRLRRELRNLGWTLNVQYSTVSRRVGSDIALQQALQLQTRPNLYWMPYGIRRLHVMEGRHNRSLY
ncbi:hypothetical protein C1645_737476 [Glomus cerebriforme]|uniref:Uncharacterized protein n=1 Tax=Glomus cerebriforme TaxID=658196 RepID=A0A397SXZ0_9GLOM|nr:hypothetical protein C1645_737476 [Glomus cerebriforme]